MMLMGMARNWVRDRAPVSSIRQARDRFAARGYDPDLYSEMAEMGWTGVLVPEAYGGSDFGMLSFGVILEELGRTLMPSPLLSSALSAASAIVLGGDEQQKGRWLPRIVSGETVAAVAIDEGAHHAPRGTALVARRSGAGWVLDGVKRPVLEGGAADLLVVAARTGGRPGEDDGISLFLVECDRPGLARDPMRNIDSRGAAVVTFSGMELGGEALLGEAGRAMPVLQAMLDRTCAGLAAEMLGSTAQAFDVTIEHLKTRTQFDRLIGSFQALQHRAADMLAEIELTRSAVRAALLALDEGDPAASRMASMAKALAGRSFRHVAQEMLQMHGGIGMTNEHDAGLYLKRAQAADVAFGNVAFHRDRYGTELGY